MCFVLSEESRSTAWVLMQWTETRGPSVVPFPTSKHVDVEEKYPLSKPYFGRAGLVFAKASNSTKTIHFLLFSTLMSQCIQNFDEANIKMAFWTSFNTFHFFFFWLKMLAPLFGIKWDQLSEPHSTELSRCWFIRCISAVANDSKWKYFPLLWHRCYCF